jgi:ACR3 family arsenite transporter
MGRKAVLILCTGNSCRSQMAEGLVNHDLASTWIASSAGSRPSGTVHPLAVEVMREVGIDISCFRSKSMAEFEGQVFDLVVTVCDNAKEACPRLPGSHTVHLPFSDPVSGNLDDFRIVRDQIRDQLEKLLLSEPTADMEKEFESSAFETQFISFDVSAVPLQAPAPLGWFGKLLGLWIALAMIIGTTLGALVPSLVEAFNSATVYQIWIPGIVLVWVMVYPMMLKVEWTALKEIPKHPLGLILCTAMNWAIQPFTMYGFARLFFNVFYRGILSPATQSQYIAGCVFLGTGPCTAMVFVWSALAKGNATYTLVQVMINDLILLGLYVPIVALLLSLSGIGLPWATVFLSIALFVVVPALLGIFTRLIFSRKCGEGVVDKIDKVFQPLTYLSLILLVVFVCIQQGNVIVAHWTDVLLIIVPLALQNIVIFAITYFAAYFLCLEHNIAGPAAFIGSSNFFELGIALCISLYGPASGAVLVAVVGALVEVPVMLLLVWFVNRTKQMFVRRVSDASCYCRKIPCGIKKTQ